MSFADDLAAAKTRRVTEPNTKTVDVQVNGTLYVLKFTEMDPLNWAEVLLVSPPRVNVPADLEVYGYNPHAACRAAALLCGVRVVDGVDVPLAVHRDPQTGKVTGSEWADLFAVMSGYEFGLVADAIWGLNEWEPRQRIEAAKKASPQHSAETLTSQ